jgi:hypothetical protein
MAEYLFKHALVPGHRLQHIAARPAPSPASPHRRGLGTAVSGLCRNPPGDPRASLRRSRDRRQGHHLLAPCGQIVGGQISRA